MYINCFGEKMSLNSTCNSSSLVIEIFLQNSTCNLSSSYRSKLSPKSSSPSSSSSSAALSPINSESSSKGGRSLPGLEVRGSVRLPLEPREGLVAAENGSDEVFSCWNKMCKQNYFCFSIKNGTVGKVLNPRFNQLKSFIKVYSEKYHAKAIFFCQCQIIQLFR